MENLNVKGMVKNRRLAKSISDCGWSEFRRQIAYKLAWCGSDIIIADRFFPSSKTCSRCGVIKKDLELSDRTFICEVCGLELDRDLNAALNLRALAVSSTVTACRETIRPKEALHLLAVSMKQEFNGNLMIHKIS